MMDAMAYIICTSFFFHVKICSETSADPSLHRLIPKKKKKKKKRKKKKKKKKKKNDKNLRHEK